jgi:hypothetical protein
MLCHRSRISNWQVMFIAVSNIMASSQYRRHDKIICDATDINCIVRKKLCINCNFPSFITNAIANAGTGSGISTRATKDHILIIICIKNQRRLQNLRNCEKFSSFL